MKSQESERAFLPSVLLCVTMRLVDAWNRVGPGKTGNQMIGPDDNEEELLRSTALQNAQSVLQARQRAEEELARTKEALESRTRELARSLAIMGATLESTTDGILVTDGHERVTSFNEQFVTIWQPPRSVLESRDHRLLIQALSRRFPDPMEFVVRIDAICASSSRESYDLLWPADGRAIERFSRILFVEERNVGRVWSFRDITDRMRVEETRTRLAALVESSEDAIVGKTLESVIVTWNTGATRLFGYTAEEVIGRPITILIPADRRDEEAHILELLRRGERIEHYDTVRLSKDGRRIDVSLTVSPVLDNAGRVVAASSIARDITAQKLAQQALRESERRFRLVAEMIPSMVWTAAPDGAITFANGRWFDFSGLAHERDASRWPELALHPEDRQRCLETWTRALHDGTAYEIEARHRRHDGAYRWFVTRAVPMRDAAGRIVQWFGISTDIEDRKRAEQLSRFLADASATLAELTDYASTLQRVASLAVPVFADWCIVEMQEAGDALRPLAVMHTDPERVRLAHELFRKYPPGGTNPTDP